MLSTYKILEGEKTKKNPSNIRPAIGKGIISKSLSYSPSRGIVHGVLFLLCYQFLVYSWTVCESTRALSFPLIRWAWQCLLCKDKQGQERFSLEQTGYMPLGRDSALQIFTWAIHCLFNSPMTEECKIVQFLNKLIICKIWLTQLRIHCNL